MTKLFYMLFAVLVLIEHYKVQAVVGGDWVRDIRHTNYVAAIFHNSKYRCGATIISERRVATAAHCVLGLRMSYQTSGIVLSFGSLDTNEYAMTRYVRTEDILVHPNYTTAGYVHDIAVLEFEEPLDFTNPRNGKAKVGKAKLVPQNYSPKGGDEVIALGFTQGDIEHKQIAYSKLRFNPTTVKDFDECKEESRRYLPPNWRWLDGKSQICLNLKSGTNNINPGDSGSTLLTVPKDEFLGIVSYGTAGLFEVLVNVGGYHQFLNNPRDYPGIGVSPGIKRQHYEWWNVQ